ncbi:hypothetical protein CA13_69200 [Planctomycetes bacterium CA13]|uniref:Uncharacterized protein n=1 Tax=Novipirellula herctigrandis TaxID=2527986 RepID=A0A5C5YNF1_9BACT|nr:hypothetical protein CA13_69200 [Planctomycetes bacterium CA13]
MTRSHQEFGSHGPSNLAKKARCAVRNGHRLIAAVVGWFRGVPRLLCVKSRVRVSHRECASGPEYSEVLDIRRLDQGVFQVNGLRFPHLLFGKNDLLDLRWQGQVGRADFSGNRSRTTSALEWSIEAAPEFVSPWFGVFGRVQCRFLESDAN